MVGKALLKRGGLKWWEGVSGGTCGGVCVEGETKFLPKVGLPGFACRCLIFKQTGWE